MTRCPLGSMGTEGDSRCFPASACGPRARAWLGSFPLCQHVPTVGGGLRMEQSHCWGGTGTTRLCRQPLAQPGHGIPPPCVTLPDRDRARLQWDRGQPVCSPPSVSRSCKGHVSVPFATAERIPPSHRCDRGVIPHLPWGCPMSPRDSGMSAWPSGAPQSWGQGHSMGGAEPAEPPVLSDRWGLSCIPSAAKPSCRQLGGSKCWGTRRMLREVTNLGAPTGGYPGSCHRISPARCVTAAARTEREKSPGLQGPRFSHSTSFNLAAKRRREQIRTNTAASGPGRHAQRDGPAARPAGRRRKDPGSSLRPRQGTAPPAPRWLSPGPPRSGRPRSAHSCSHGCSAPSGSGPPHGARGCAERPRPRGGEHWKQ